MHGKFFNSPLKDPKRILDCGTGTGIWAIEIGRMAIINLCGITSDLALPSGYTQGRTDSGQRFESNPTEMVSHSLVV